tara:strand:- start:4917 stop:5201 length:285 start_codon:yes stop_codon:yes gene_type:complete
MANIVITKKGNSGLYVDFGGYSSSELQSPQGFNGKLLEHVEPYGAGVVVKMSGRDSGAWYVAHTATAGFLTIDTINGVPLLSKSDLIDKLTALM